MPKRSIKDKIQYYNEKLKKLERKSCKKRRRHVILSSDSEDLDEHGPVQQLSPKDDHLDILDPVHELQRPESPVVMSQEQEPTIEPPPVAELDPELLDALGDASVEIPTYGPPIHETLAQRWLPILKKGLQADVKEKLLKVYAVPDNCKLLKAPSLNAEISAAINEVIRARDKKILERQDQLGLAITAISKAMTTLLTSDDKVKAIKILSDSCRMLNDLHYLETMMRTKLITPALDKSFLSVIIDQNRDETLFGCTLPEKIKASKAIEKQGLQIKKAPTPKASTSGASASHQRPRYQGNWTAPPRHQSSSRGGRTAPFQPYRNQYQPNQYRRAPTAPAATTRMPAPSSVTAHRRAPTRP